jgi:hypothetical protein
MPLPLAVLIDAENIPAALFGPLQREVTRLGVPIAWQLHGDFFTWPHPGWQAVAERESVEIRHQPQAGKNSADIAMTIAAMDLMRDGVVRGICLVSSDSDFAPLARRIRAANLVVHGFGETKTREGFRRACSTFHVLVPDEMAALAPLPSFAAPVSADTYLAPAEIRRLREVLTKASGPDGILDLAIAAATLRAQVPTLADRIVVKGKFTKHLATNGLVDVQTDGTRRLVRVRQKALEVVRD